MAAGQPSIRSSFAGAADAVPRSLGRQKEYVYVREDEKETDTECAAHHVCGVRVWVFATMDPLNLVLLSSNTIPRRSVFLNSRNADDFVI